MAPIFPAVDQWNIREIIPRRIDPWGCFVGQLVPLHEIIPPGCHGWKTHHLRTEHLWRAWTAPWTFRSTFLCIFFVKTFKNLGTVFHCDEDRCFYSNVEYLCLHSHHTKVATGYQIVAIGYTYILLVTFKPAQVCCGNWLHGAHKPNTLSNLMTFSPGTHIWTKRSSNILQILSNFHGETTPENGWKMVDWTEPTKISSETPPRAHRNSAVSMSRA